VGSLLGIGCNQGHAELIGQGAKRAIEMRCREHGPELVQPCESMGQSLDKFFDLLANVRACSAWQIARDTGIIAHKTKGGGARSSVARILHESTFIRIRY